MKEWKDMTKLEKTLLAYKSYKGQRPYTTITEEQYIKLTKRCPICNATFYIQIHHIDFNPHNDNPNNVIGLCLKCHHFAENKKFKGMPKDILIPKLKEHIQQYYYIKWLK